MIDLALAFFGSQFFTHLFVLICFMMKKNNILNLLLSLGVSFSTASLSKAELVEGLIEYWEFDGDFSAGLDEANDGILEQSGIGKASFVAGKFGSAVDLENSGGAGNQAVINVGAPGEFAFEAGSMSVSVDGCAAHSVGCSLQPRVPRSASVSDGKISATQRVGRPKRSTDSVLFTNALLPRCTSPDP